MKRHAIKSLTIASILCAASSPALARLGSFEPADGYDINAFSGSFNWSDVSYYNAGQYGANAGGGPGPTLAAPNSGLWKITSSPGGFYTTAAQRATFTAGAPPYPTSSASAGNTFPIYIVGNHFGGRTGTALALRNDNQATGAMEYDYRFDNFDFGGIAPASVTSGNVSTKFYFCPNPVDPSTQEKFIMSFKDTSGSTGLQIGYQRDNQVYWRPGSAGPWVVTPIIADAFNYDGWTVDVNLSAQTFSLQYFDFSTSLNIPLAANVPLGNPMGDVTHLGWWLNDSVSSGIGGKNFFDDFAVTTPEPSAAGVIAVGGLALLRRRRRR